MTNSQIARLLRNVACAYTIKNDRKYRFQIIAYQKASEAIENSPIEVKDLIREGQLDTIPGIGPSIGAHLEELIKKGKVKHFDWVFQGIPQAVFGLLDVPTFGPKKAYKLVSHFKLRKPALVIDDVEKLAKKGKIAPIEGFGERSQEDILRAISEYKRGRNKTTRMALPFAFELAGKLLSHLKKSKAVIQVHPLGSLRRMVSTIGDVDFAVATNDPGEVIRHFIAYPYKERVIEKGDTTASILISGGKQIDLMTMPPESFGSLLQHFTGSKNHNVHLREYALTRGLSLSEYGIKRLRSNRVEQFSAEEKFYEALGLDWIPPEIREDTGEIEASFTKKLPHLIELSEIRGDLHIHSDYPIEPSHDLGRNSMTEMLEKAQKLGYEYLGFSEHNPSVSKHTKNQIYTILARRQNKIEQIKERNKNVRIINLLEVDILSNGSVAIDEKSFSTLDAVLVSIHSSFGMGKKEMTKRVLVGLSHPKAKILSHPTGRLLNIREGYELDFDQIFDFCKKHSKALEINGWPTRLDLPDIMVREAVNLGVRMVVNTDSHAAYQMDNMRYGVAVAKRGWAEKKDILNTLPYEEFIKWLKTEGR